MFPKWNTLNSSSVYSMTSVMEIDGLKSTHEVSVEICKSKDIEQVFDDISYEKEAILIRMMQMLLGKDVFQNGIRNYLKTYSYKNAETSDLWKALTNSSLEAGVLEKSLTIDSIMSSWALQSGFPVVHVVRNYTENSAVITQKRYFTLKPQHKSDKKKSDSCWMIPLTYTTSTELNFKEIKVKKWLYCDQLQIDNIAFKNDWIIFNINFQGIKGF